MSKQSCIARVGVRETQRPGVSKPTISFSFLHSGGFFHEPCFACPSQGCSFFKAASLIGSRLFMEGLSQVEEIGWGETWRRFQGGMWGLWGYLRKGEEREIERRVAEVQTARWYKNKDRKVHFINNTAKNISVDSFVPLSNSFFRIKIQKLNDQVKVYAHLTF